MCEKTTLTDKIVADNQHSSNMHSSDGIGWKTEGI
jgi:hypothetical protein